MPVINDTVSENNPTDTDSLTISDSTYNRMVDWLESVEEELSNRDFEDVDFVHVGDETTIDGYTVTIEYTEDEFTVGVHTDTEMVVCTREEF